MNRLIRFVWFSLLVTLVGFGLRLGSWSSYAPTATVRAFEALPVELVVAPAQAWHVGVAPREVIALRGTNGFTGTVTVTLNGLPDGTTWRCDSNCTPGLGTLVTASTTTYTVPVQAGIWTSFAPQSELSPPGPGESVQTYSVTVTASASGYSSVSQTFSYRVQPSLSAADINCQIPSGATQPFSPSNKQTVTAGESATFSCSMKVGGYTGAWTDGTVVIYRTSPAGSNYDPSIVTSFVPASQAFTSTSEASVGFSVATTPSTPAGVYTFSLGMLNTDGFQTAVADTILTVVSPAVSNPAPSPSSSTPSNSSSTPSNDSSTSSTTAATNSDSPSSSATDSASLTSSKKKTDAKTSQPTAPTPKTTPTATESATETPASKITSLAAAPAVIADEDGEEDGTDAEDIALAYAAPGATATVLFVVLSWLLPFLSTLPMANLLAWLGVFFTGSVKPGLSWGQVVDADVNQPLAGALVQLLNADGRVVASDRTDRQGQFTFVPTPGRYTLESSFPGYSLAREAAGYHGEALSVTSTRPLAVTIPLAPNLAALTSRIHLIQSLAQGISSLRLPLMLLGTVAEVYLLIDATRPLDGWLLFLYALLWGIQLQEWLKRPAIGTVVSSRAQPLPLALVRALKNGTHLVATKVTDPRGSFLFHLHQGRYQLTATKAGYDRASTNATLTRDGVIKTTLTLTARGRE